jgi:hypothetical protein
MTPIVIEFIPLAPTPTTTVPSATGAEIEFVPTAARPDSISSLTRNSTWAVDTNAPGGLSEVPANAVLPVTRPGR